MKNKNEYWPGSYVIIESPYAGDVAKNVLYARRCVRDSIKHDEYPFASHLLYTQAGILDDTIPAERERGIALCEMWSLRADVTVLYLDYGMSPGMAQAIKVAKVNGRATSSRFIGEV